MFVGSLIEDDTKELVKLAKKMKKNNVAVDFINFGEESENTEKLEKFREGVNSNDNSHVVTVPPGPHLLANQLTALFVDSEFGGSLGGASGLGGAGDLGDDSMGGILDQFDPNVDPELALALRMSLEDEKARQEKVKREQAEKEKAEKEAEDPATTSSAGPSENTKSDKDEQPKKDKDGDDLMEL